MGTPTVQLYALMDFRAYNLRYNPSRVIFSLRTTQTHWARLLFKLVGIPIICVTLLSLVLLYIIGGTDLLRFTASQLLTWRGIQRALTVVGGLTLLSWLRHMAWYQDEPPPMWFRRSVWLNVMDGLTLIAVIALGVWAFRRYAPPPLSTH